jgi:hypothetical protein
MTRIGLELAQKSVKTLGRLKPVVIENDYLCLSSKVNLHCAIPREIALFFGFVVVGC